MPNLRLAVATKSLLQPLKQAVQSASEIGVQGVQINAGEELRPSDLTATGRREFLHRLRELGLSVASLRFPTRRVLYNQEQLDARLSALREVMQFAWHLQAGIVTLRVGRLPEADSSQYHLLCEILNDLARYGNRIGAVLAISPSHDSPQALGQLVETISEGPIGVDFDPAAFVMAGYDPGEALRRLHSSIMHVEVRDAIRDVDGTGREVPVGRGEVPWEECLALLDDARYRGWLTVERTAGDQKPQDVARAIQYLRNVIAG